MQGRGACLEDLADAVDGLAPEGPHEDRLPLGTRVHAVVALNSGRFAVVEDMLEAIKHEEEAVDFRALKVSLVTGKAGVEFFLVKSVDVSESSVHDHVLALFSDRMQGYFHEAIRFLPIPH